MPTGIDCSRRVLIASTRLVYQYLTLSFYANSPLLITNIYVQSENRNN